VEVRDAFHRVPKFNESDQGRGGNASLPELRGSKLEGRGQQYSESRHTETSGWDTSASYLALVAQTCSLPYRRFSICGAPMARPARRKYGGFDEGASSRL
jgi:hypothetical protein